MSFCKNCGAGLGTGRFCTNCGSPVLPMTPQDPAAPPSTAPPSAAPPSTPAAGAGPAHGPAPEESAAERTAVRMPAVPDAAPTHGPRYPLFVDELPTRSPGDQAGTHAAPGPVGAGTPAGIPAGAAPPSENLTRGRPESHRAPSSRAGWIVAAVLLLLLCGVGLAWIIDGDGDRNAADASGSADSGQAEDDRAGPGDDSGDDSGDGAGEDSGGDAEEGNPPQEPPGDPVDLARQATASGPAPREPGTDFAGNRQTYPPQRMLDRDPETAYRMPGDSSGATITFDLPEEATIHEVGLVNGYAKTDVNPQGQTINWYDQNRRIREVEWVFDDGTSISQDLGETTDLQTISVDGVTTSSIELRIVSVSAPGGGKWGKNTTAISSVLLRGSSS